MGLRGSPAIYLRLMKPLSVSVTNFNRFVKKKLLQPAVMWSGIINLHKDCGEGGISIFRKCITHQETNIIKIRK